MRRLHCPLSASHLLARNPQLRQTGDDAGEADLLASGVEEAQLQLVQEEGVGDEKQAPQHAQVRNRQLAARTSRPACCERLASLEALQHQADDASPKEEHLADSGLRPAIEVPAPGRQGSCHAERTRRARARGRQRARAGPRCALSSRLQGAVWLGPAFCH